MSTHHGWVSYGSGDNAHLSDEVRTEMDRRMRERRERQGALLATVEVRVYEHEEEPQVSFPPEALLGIETEQSVIREVVRRAREQLTHWR
ncbi:MAG: hypothetical protein WAL61_06970 [Acidimicrobiales bacterium]